MKTKPSEVLAKLNEEIPLFLQGVVNSSIFAGITLATQLKELKIEEIQQLIQFVLEHNSTFYEKQYQEGSNYYDLLNAYIQEQINKEFFKEKCKAIRIDNMILIFLEMDAEQIKSSISELYNAYEDQENQDQDSYMEFMNVVGNILSGYLPLQLTYVNHYQDKLGNAIPGYTERYEKFLNGTLLFEDGE
ncbi:hypothetical protein PaeCFBP13512_18775 [Paenibacillus sp. CFBP13512]|uniref:hypothetical protein n=1 Tax=Paenibacillus sp. CFBP13512 TaxID=2184007 RepID=UPI0010BF96EC|nr:hypothetical protein [Paenibacillus sp. CFBP13512]TKJ87267.1 hypothetical protein PaeCFBP13512_18775 [Paenibacillus sp. CFBP13512]